jgi:CheY-like chemotaxis protein
MDIGMPVVGGLEAARLLHACPETRDIPVVALAAYTAQGRREQAVSAGCRDFVSKPIGMRVLGELIARHMSRSAGKYPRPV